MTLKELAKECNFHPNTIRKWLIKKTSSSINAEFIIDEGVLNKAKKHFLKEVVIDDKNNHNYNEILVAQLTQKDIQIVKQQEQINQLQKLLENQPILTLQAN